MDDITARTLSITRTFEAPVALLWKVLTTAEYIKDWWGPDGFTNTIRKMDVTEGGTWAFTMHGPNGTDYENEYIYTEIIPQKKIVLNHLRKPKFTIRITLYGEGNQTKIEWQNVFDSEPGLQQAINAFKADIGLQQNMDRFSNYLSKHKYENDSI